MKIVYIVIAVCNLDDVLMGVYAQSTQAQQRAKVVFAKPELRFRQRRHQSVDSHCLGVKVYAAKGAKIELIEYHEYDPLPDDHHDRVEAALNSPLFVGPPTESPA